MDDVEREDAGPETPLPHAGPWSEADYRALGSPDLDDSGLDNTVGKILGEGRVELVDGTLVIGPGPTADAERAVARTRAALGDALPDGLCVVGPVKLRMGPDCVLVPDLVVMRAPADTDAEPDAVVDGREVLMVVEVVGSEHGAVDRTFKPLVYARARLPYLLLVDREAPFASASMVISGRYHEYARAGGDDELELEEPFRLRLPLRDRG